MRKTPVLDKPRITPKELENFKEIARKDYGRELSDEQATEQATVLLNMFDYFIDKKWKEMKLT